MWFAWITLCFSFFWNAALPQFEAVTLQHVKTEPHRYSRIRLWGSVGFIVAVLGVGQLLDGWGIDRLPVVVPRFRSKPNGEQVPVGTDWGRIKKEWLMGKDSKAGKIATNWATPEGDGWKIARSVKEVLEKLKPMFPKIPFTLKQGDGAHGLETRILVGTDTFVMGGGLRNDPKWTLLVYKQGQNPGLNEYEKSNGWNKPVPDADQIMTIVHKVLKESPDWV